jgi:hypothetical protein
MQFNVLYAAHATNGKSYIVDAFFHHTETKEDAACDCVLEDCDADNDFLIAAKDATYTIKCRWKDDWITYEVYKDGTLLSPDDYEVCESKYRADEDDPIWEVLGYETEEEE